MEFSNPKVRQERQLTKLIKQRLKLKQKRPKIVIGPIKGGKLRLNEKKFKFPTLESKVKVENITTDKVNEEKAELVEDGFANSVETPTYRLFAFVNLFFQVSPSVRFFRSITKKRMFCLVVFPCSIRRMKMFPQL